MTREKIEAFVEFLGIEKLFLADGFEDAFLGISYQCGSASACYNRERCIQILMARDSMSMEEAEEYFEFNVAGAYVGEGMPSFLVQFVEWS